MKKLLLLFALLMSFVSGLPQTKLDTLVSEQGKKVDGISKNVAAIKVDVDSAKVFINAQKENAAKINKDCISCEIGFIQWVLIFSPIWVFIIALFFIRKKLKDFNLKEALSESEFPKKTIPNPEYTSDKLNDLAKNAATSAVLATLIPPTIEVTASTDYPKSSSRYIAFITSALTWIIVLCLSCFFIYQYMKTNKAPELTGLSTVMLALGIGVVPYAFNKVSAAMK
jgi:small-conductance mechanosensitive channel